MVSSIKSLSQALMIVSDTLLEIISSGFILRDNAESCPWNYLTLLWQYPVAQRVDYSVRHANPYVDPWFLLRLLLVPILAKVIVTEISPLNYINSVTSYAFHPCGTAFVRGTRVNISFPHQSETLTVLGYHPMNHPPFHSPFIIPIRFYARLFQGDQGS